MIGVDVDTSHGNWSSNARLARATPPMRSATARSSLFLKMVTTDLGDGEYFDDSEVTYYTRDYTDVPAAPLVRCHHAAYSEAARAYHLLLDDVSGTHVEATGPSTHAWQHALALADGLAAMHARWWGADRLAAVDQPIHAARRTSSGSSTSPPSAFPHVLDQSTIELAAALARRDHAASSDGHSAAMIDRDPNDRLGSRSSTEIRARANILVPRHGDRPVFLIDRQPFDWSLTTWLGVYDLVYATVLDWPVRGPATTRAASPPALPRLSSWPTVSPGTAGTSCWPTTG